MRGVRAAAWFPERWRWRVSLAAPMLFCLWLDWLGIRTWFAADDFAWLGLRLRVDSFGSLVWALFQPFAQGTVRTLSERAYFIALSSIFGLHALPFHILAFLTQCVALGVLAACMRRMTGSMLAAALTPVLWMCSAVTAQPMSWSSAYNEILCGALLAGAFYFLLRHIDSGARRDLAGMWACYLLGFGALEHIVVFPALAAAWAMCRAPGYFRRTLPLFVPAALFAIVHFTLIPPSTDPIYRLYFDRSILKTAGTYWLLSTGAFRAADDWFAPPHAIGLALTLCVSAALGGVALRRALNRDFRGLFFVAWYLLLLAPVLPLRNHVQDYYLMLPVSGLAMLGAWGVALAFEHKRVPAIMSAVLLAGAYCGFAARDLHTELGWYYDRGNLLRTLIGGIANQRRTHPGDIILLDGVSDRLFWSGFGDHPFRLLGLGRIYLAPGSESAINPHPEWGGISDYLIPASAALRALDQGQAEVLTVVPGGLLETTASFRKVLSAERADTSRWLVDLGDPADAARLGPEWYPIEHNSRWMPRSATLTIGAPDGPGWQLALTGFCPAALVERGPLHLTASANGVPLGVVTIDAPDQAVLADFALPAQLTGAGPLHVTLSLDRTLQLPDDPRDLGMPVQRIEVRPKT